MFLKYQLIKYKKNKNKGSMMIMHVIEILIVVMVLAFLLDLIVITSQFVYMSRIGNEIARTIAIQSGVETRTPKNYPGGDAAYFTTSEIENYLQDSFKSVHMGEYRLKINNRDLRNNASFRFNKAEPITVELTGSFKWNFIRFIPGVGKAKELKVSKTVFSEYMEQ